MPTIRCPFDQPLSARDNHNCLHSHGISAILALLLTETHPSCSAELEQKLPLLGFTFAQKVLFPSLAPERYYGVAGELFLGSCIKRWGQWSIQSCFGNALGRSETHSWGWAAWHRALVPGLRCASSMLHCHSSVVAERGIKGTLCLTSSTDGDITISNLPSPCCHVQWWKGLSEMSPSLPVFAGTMWWEPFVHCSDCTYALVLSSWSLFISYFIFLPTPLLPNLFES